jgi:hypothetical protein
MNTQTYNLNFARNFIFKSLLLITVFLSIGNGWGQVTNYTFNTSTGTYNSITGTQIIAPGTDDGSSSATIIGFDFVFNGTTFTQFVANSNGCIRLGSSAPSSGSNAISDGSNTNMIAFFSRDGKAVGGVFYETSGSAPNRVLTIQYINYAPAYATTSNLMDAQIKLFEGTNQISIVYGASTTSSSYTGQVGIRGTTTSTDYSNRLSTTSWAASTSGTSTTSTMTFSSTVKPTSGLTFSWSPPVPCVIPANQPTSLSFSSISSTSISGSFTAAASSPSGYLVVRSTSPNPPSPIDGTTYAAAATTLGSGTYVIQSSSATSFTSSSLSGNTTYYYHIFSYNNTGCSGGPKYLTVSPLSLSSTTCASSPSASAASNIATTSFTANWSASSGGAPLNYLLYVATDNSFTNLVSGYNGLDVGTVTNYSVTGLSAATTYYYRIMAVANSCNSTNSSTITITTLCSPELAPTQVQNFSTFTGAAPSPICWSESSGALTASSTLSGTTSNWTKKTNGFANANASNVGASINLYSNSTNWLISNPIDLGNSAGLYRLKYKYAVTSYNGTSTVTTLSSHKVEIVISTDGGNTWSNTNIIKTYAGAGSYSNTGFEELINLTNFSGLIKIAFVATCVSSSDIDFHIDDVQVEAIPSCMQPTNLLVSSITANQAALGWTETGTASVWDVELGSSGFMPSGSPSQISVSNPYTYTGLSANTAYQYYVRANCGNNDFSTWVGPFSFTTLKIEPTNQVTNLGVGTVTSTAIPLSWTAAVAGSQAPDGYLIKGSSVSLAAISDPVDGTDQTDVTVFTSNAANKKQTTGTATSTTTFTGTSPGTMYYYKVYSYSNSGAGIDFKTDNPATLTYATKPNSVSSTLTAESITSSSIDFSWTAATGYISATNEYLIFAKAGSAITVGSPTQNPSQYTASSTFGNGTSYQGDASAFCVFKGDGNSISLSGLNASTTYYFLIYSVVDLANSNGSFSYSSETGVNRSTLQIPAQLPYIDDFSNSNNLTFINGTQTNKWSYGSITGNTGSSIYISNDNGVSNIYTNSISSIVHAYRDIVIPSGVSVVNFSFDWKSKGEVDFDYLRVWLVPISYTPSASSPIVSGSGRIQVGGNFQNVTTWQSYSSSTLNVSSFENSTMRLVFEWRNDGSQGTSPPAAIDNISVNFPTYTWSGASSNDPSISSNWSSGTLPTANSNIIIPSNVPNYPTYTSLTIAQGNTFTLQSNAQLTISGALTNNGTLTLESGATIVQGSSSTLAGSGTYNVKQAITGDGTTTPSGRFWYLGSPVSLASSSVYFASNAANVVKKRSESTNAWTALSSGTPENLVVGQGYYTQAIPANSTINFTGGLLNNGAISITNLTRTAGQGFEGFNLVSNPYPSYLNWDVVSRTNVDGTMWYRTHDGTNMVFETYVAGAAGGVGTNLSGNTATKYIPPMQSYWVRVTQGQTSGSLALDNTMRSHFASLGSSTAGLRSTQDDPSLFLRMNLLQANKKDQLIVYVNEQATNGFDMLDGEKMMQAGYPQFYTKAGDKKIVINGLNSAKKQQALPVTIELPTTGVHSFVIEDLEISNGLVWLEDKQEEIIQALEPGTVYQFYANAGMNAERFVLHFQLIDDAVPTIVYNEVNSSANFSGKGANVYAESAGVVVIKLPASAEGVTDIQIRDAAGKLVYAGSMNNLETSVELAQANGIYYVTLSSNTGVEVHKVFIQQ